MNASHFFCRPLRVSCHLNASHNNKVSRAGLQVAASSRGIATIRYQAHDNVGLSEKELGQKQGHEGPSRHHDNSHSPPKPQPIPSDGFHKVLSTPKPQLIHPDLFRQLMRLVPRPVAVVTSVYYPPLPSTTEPSHPQLGVPSAGKPSPRGMTISSFSSLSITPIPRITFSIQLPSRTYDAIKSSRRFNVAVMRATLDGSCVAEAFTMRTPQAKSFQRPSKAWDPAFGELLGLRIRDDRAFHLELKKLQCRLENMEKADEYWQDLLALHSQGRLPDISDMQPTQPKGRVSSLPQLTGPPVLYTLRCRLADDVHGYREGDDRDHVPGLINIGDSVIVIGDVEDCVREGGLLNGPLRGEGLGADKKGLAYVFGRYQKVTNLDGPRKLERIQREKREARTIPKSASNVSEPGSVAESESNVQDRQFSQKLKKTIHLE